MGLYAYEVKYKALDIEFSTLELYDILKKFFYPDSGTTLFPVDSDRIEEILKEDESSQGERIYRKLKHGEASVLTAKERKILKTLKRLADERDGVFEIAIS